MSSGKTTVTRAHFPGPMLSIVATEIIDTPNASTAIVPAAPMTIAALADVIYDHFRNRGMDKNTPPRVRVILGILERDVGVNTVADLEREEIDDILGRFNACNARYSLHTQADRFRLLCRIIRVGYELGLIRVLPRLPRMPQTFNMPKGRSTEPPPAQDIGRLMDQLARDKSWKGRRLHALTSTVYLARLPVEVALRIEAVDVDYEKKTITTRRPWLGEIKRREVGIGDDLVEILKAWAPQSGCRWLFPGAQRRGPWLTGGLHHHSPVYALAGACRAAGISPAITFAQLRRFHSDTVRPYVPFATFSARVILGRQTDPVMVNGKEQPPLAVAQYNLIKALWNAAPGTLTKDEIEEISGDARRVLKRLRDSSEDWASVIQMAGKKGGGYGLLV